MKKLKFIRVILTAIVFFFVTLSTQMVFALDKVNYTVDFTFNGETVKVAGDTKNHDLTETFSLLKIDEKIIDIQVYEKDTMKLCIDNKVYDSNNELIFTVESSDNKWLLNSYKAFNDEYFLIATSDTKNYKVLVTDPKTDPIETNPNSENDYTVVPHDFVSDPTYQWFKMTGYTSILNNEDYLINTGDIGQDGKSITSIYDSVNECQTIMFQLLNQPWRFSFDYNGTEELDIQYGDLVSKKDGHYIVDCPIDGICLIFSDGEFTISNVQIGVGEKISGQTSSKISLTPNELSDTIYYCELYSEGELADTSWAIIPNKISFVGDNNTTGSINDIYQFAGRKITLPSSGISKSGYDLVGWADDGTTHDIDTEYTTPEEDIILTAAWKKSSGTPYSKDITFSITPLEYDLDKTDIVVSVNDSDLKVTDFELWYYDDASGNNSICNKVEKPGLYTFYIIIEGKDKVYYFENTEVNSIDYYQGCVELDDIDTYYSTSITSRGVETCDITKTGFEFFGNSYNSEANIVLGNEIKTVLLGHTITYDDNCEEAKLAVPSDENTYLENSSAIISKDIPTRNGYVFVGWNTNKNATTAMTFTDGKYTIGSEDITLYAIWKKVIVTEPNKNNDYKVEVDSSLTNVTYQWYKLVSSYVDVKDSEHVKNWISTYNQEDNTYTSIVSFGIPKISFAPKEGVDITKVYIQYTFQNKNYIIQGKSDYSKGNPGIGVANLNGDLSNFTISNVKEILTTGVKVNNQTNAKFSLETLENASYYCDVLINGKVVATSNEIKPREVSFIDKTGTTLVLPKNIYQLEGRKVTLPNNTYTKTGYKFAGWNTKDDNTGSTYKSGEQYSIGLEDVTLYAKWDEKTAVSITDTAQVYTYNANKQEYVIDGTNKNIGSFTIQYYVNNAWTTSAPIKVGSYNVKITRAEDDTYKSFIKEITNGLVIKKVQVELPSAVTGLIYNGTSQFGITILLGAPYDLSDNTATNAGDYQATATLKDKDNYEWKLTTPTSDDQKIDYSISKKSINVKADDKSSYVGSNLVALTYTADDLCTGDSFSGSLTTEADKNTVKAYDITQGTLTAGGNYSISYTKGTYTVKSLETQTLSFTNSTVTKTYGDSKFTQSVSGAQTTVTYSSSNETVATVNSSTGEVTIKKAGSTTITAKAAKTAKYNNAETSYSLTVKKVQVEVPTAVTGLIYDGTEQLGTSILFGAPYDLSDNTATNAGNHQATATLKDKDNYEWKLATPTSDDQKIDYSIAQKTVTVTANDDSMNLNDILPTFTASVEGTLEDEEVQYTFNTINPTVQGVYSIVPTGDISQGNYIVTYIQGTLTVTEQDSDAKANPEDVAKVLDKYRQEQNYINKSLDVEVRTSSDVSITDKDLIEANKPSRSKVIMIDAKLYLIITDESNTTELDIGDENDQLIAITYAFNFNNKTDIHVLRVHNGEVKEITTTIDNKTGEYITLNKEEGTITVYAKKYSAFAFTYKNVDTQTYKPVSTGVEANNDNILKPISLLSLFGIVTIIATKKKKH